MADITICTAGCSSIDGCSCPPIPEKLHDRNGRATGVWGYRGWTISQDDFGGGWTGVSDNYDVDYQGEEDGFVDNGEKVSGLCLADCCDLIDDFIAERSALEASVSVASQGVES